MAKVQNMLSHYAQKEGTGMHHGAVIRDGKESDHSFIISSWLRSHRASGHGVSKVLAKTYFAHNHPLVERMLACSTIRVAHAPGDLNTILAFIVFRNDSLGYVYTKAAFRRFGLANELMRQLPASVVEVNFLCDSDAARTLYRKHSRLSFNPYPEVPSHVSHSSANAEADRSRPAEEWPPRH